MPHYKENSWGCTPFTEFLSLPDDVLYLIISKCDVQTLGRLSRVCHKLKVLLQSDCVWLALSKTFTLILAGNTSRHLKLKDACRISFNWNNKFYRERILLRHNPRQLPWIQYYDRTLWVSTKNMIKCYGVDRGGLTREAIICRLPFGSKDVTRFVAKDSKVVSGSRDGSVYVFDCRSGRCLHSFTQVHTTDTQAVDFHSSCIVSGSRDRTVKILSMDYDNNNNPVRDSIDVGDRIWSLAISPVGRSFTVGAAGCYSQSPISVWDIDRGQMIAPLGEFRFGAGVLDLKYESPYTLLSCGYDASLRLWDLRSGRCEMDWYEPFDTTLYCLQSDKNVAMVTGSSRYGMVRYWDKRRSDPLQVYYIGQKNSPVYSIAFDSARLYTALDLSINMADFSVLPP